MNNAAIFGMTRSSHKCRTRRMYSLLGGKASSTTTYPPGLVTRYISAMPSSKSGKFRRVYTVVTTSKEFDSYRKSHTFPMVNRAPPGFIFRASSSMTLEQSMPSTSSAMPR